MISQQNITAITPTGTQLIPGGATFKVFAPRAAAVYLNGTFNGVSYHEQTPDQLLSRDSQGYWTGFQSGAADGDLYRFWVTGTGSAGYKRDPYATELSPAGDFPDCFGVLRAMGSYPWHDAGFRTPDFSDIVIYQAHIGTYAIAKAGISSNFLDVAGKVPYLSALGINMLQPLPMDEQEVNPGMGYGGADLFSPDFPYVADPSDLAGYLGTINGLFTTKGLAPLTLADITAAPAQLKVLVDLCHVYGVAVAFDVVYNHAGGFSVEGALDDDCLYYFDRVSKVGNNNDSLYFTDQDRGTGGLAFAMWNQEVCQLLLDNAQYYIDEFHADGLRYDEISILLSTNQSDGWAFCRALTTQLRASQPRFLQNAEFWPGEFGDIPSNVTPILQPAADGGAGFDVVQHDALRNALRAAIESASYGASAQVSMSAIADVLYPPGLDHSWRAVTCVENHDLVMVGRDPRIPMLADATAPAGWYARSRSRVATGLLLTAPGIPQLFMGQEFLESQQWDVPPSGPYLLDWTGLNTGNPVQADYLRFTQDLLHLRAAYPALRGDNVHAYYTSDADRVLAYHRSLPTGQDVVVVATLAESTWWNYDLGFPVSGAWQEVFNSDVYDNWVNPWTAGNGGAIQANGPPMHGCAASASIVIPANAFVVFARNLN
jgi:1,4-alpha-glucan branching enzyme